MCFCVLIWDRVKFSKFSAENRKQPIAKLLFHCSLSSQMGHLSLYLFNERGYVFINGGITLFVFGFACINISTRVSGLLDPGTEDC